MAIITPERYLLALHKTPVLLNALIHAVSQEQAQQLTDGPDGWSVVETMCHLRDFAPVALERSRLILEHENPALPNFDPTEHAKQRDYAHQVLADEFAAFLASRREFVALLETLSPDQWQRTGVHSSYGEGTLLEFTTHVVWHDLNHIEQITRSLKLSEALV